MKRDCSVVDLLAQLVQAEEPGDLTEGMCAKIMYRPISQEHGGHVSPGVRQISLPSVVAPGRACVSPRSRPRSLDIEPCRTLFSHRSSLHSGTLACTGLWCRALPLQHLRPLGPSQDDAPRTGVDTCRVRPQAFPMGLAWQTSDRTLSRHDQYDRFGDLRSFHTRHKPHQGSHASAGGGHGRTYANRRAGPRGLHRACSPCYRRGSPRRPIPPTRTGRRGSRAERRKDPTPTPTG